jgi:hypothetical protein
VSGGLVHDGAVQIDQLRVAAMSGCIRVQLSSYVIGFWMARVDAARERRSNINKSTTSGKHVRCCIMPPHRMMIG